MMSEGHNKAYDDAFVDVVEVGTWKTTRMAVSDAHGKKTLRVDVYDNGRNALIEMRDKAGEVVASMRIDQVDLAELIYRLRPVLEESIGASRTDGGVEEEGSGA